MLIDVLPERYREVLDVLHSAFATGTSEFGITAQNTPSNPAFWDEGEITRVVARSNQLFALEEDGRILGCAFTGPSRSRERTWVLRHLAVLPDARRRGLGEALVGEAARRAVRGGASVLRIGIVAANTRLSDWYHRLGFVTVESGTRYPGLVFAVDHLEIDVKQVCR
jgi:ribosomal protein S18 acetylase RimI-like enzyme